VRASNTPGIFLTHRVNELSQISACEETFDGDDKNELDGLFEKGGGVEEHVWKSGGAMIVFGIPQHQFRGVNGLPIAET
jgi:hypothetical protein